MTEFVVDFGRSVEELTRFQLGLTAIGKRLDKLETGSTKSATAASKLFEKLEAEYKKLETALSGTTSKTEQIGSIMERVRGETAKMMSGIAASNLRATVSAQAYNGQMAEMLRLMSDTSSKNAFVRSQQRIIETQQTLINQNNELRAKITAMDTAEGKLNEALKQQLAHLKRLSTDMQRSSQAYSDAERKLQSLNREQVQDTEIMKAMIAGRKLQITENTRLDYTLQGLERAYKGLNGGLQLDIELMRIAVNARKAEVTEAAREDVQLKQLQRTLASLSGGRQEEITKLQGQISARKRAITEGQKEQKVVSEQQRALERERQTLERLQAQMNLVSSARGRQIEQIKAQIRDQEALNRITATSTAQLLGFHAAQNRLNLSQQVGSQSAAMLRAGLQGLHASVGMYTSATILAATATYGMAAALRDSVVTGAEFQATMSRTEAIMSSNGPGWMDRTAQTAALNKEVRALGQSTVFTASEVAEGLQQIGMAGISAADAMTALPATLTLANLANVNMARSADIATNVLMTFNMQAKELGQVVDLMATAVNNSNTDIEQLANALSYAGPAAQTAGISLQETVAAVETLANSGIKASRAGSALRRLFVSILNPTKKGRDVISKYGLSIQDAEGKTRSLVDIVGQLNKALKGLDGGERLSAIQNLVGVYATSPVAALVANQEKFASFAEQNKNVDGAGQRMEKIISDNLKFDWKALLSALEEVQLQAFDSMGMRLRELVAGLTVDVLKVMEPVKTVLGSDGQEITITGLDELMAKGENLAKTLGAVAAGFLAYKTLNGSIFGALSTDLTKVSRNLTEVQRRANITGTGLLVMGSNADGTRSRMDLLNLALGRTTTAAGFATGAVALLARGLSALAMAGSVLMRLAGWVGMAYGVYTALQMVFGKDTDQQIIDHKESVDEVESSYDKLRNTLKDLALVKQRAALTDVIASNKAGTTQVTARMTSNQNLINAARTAGQDEKYIQPLVDEQKALNAQLLDYKGKTDDAERALSQLGTTSLDYDKELTEHKSNLQTVVNLTDQLTLARANLEGQSKRTTGLGLNDLSAKQNISRLEQELLLAKQRTTVSGESVANTLRDIPTAEDRLREAADEKVVAAAAENYKKLTPLSQQLLDKEKEITAERMTQAALIERDKNARLLTDQGEMLRMMPGQDEVEASAKRMAELDSDRLVLQEKVKDQEVALAETRANAAEAEMTDTQRLLNLKTRLTEVDAQILAAESVPDGKAKDLSLLNDLYKRQLQYRQNIKTIEGRESKEGARGAKADNKELEQAQRTYDGLAKKIDPVTHAQTQLAEGTKAMTLLRANSRITMAQEAKALGELNLQYYQATLEADKHRASLSKLLDTYNNSSFKTVANDMATLSRAYKDGKVSLQDYQRISAQIKKDNVKQATDGLPKANLSLGDASSNPFSDWITSELERAEDMKAFETRRTDMQTDFANQIAANTRELDAQRQMLDAKKLNAEAHNAEMLDIERQYREENMALVTAYGDRQTAVTTQQTQYAADMGKMALISAGGAINNVLGMFASASAEATGAQKAAFVAQKAIAVAMIMIYTEMAAARATGEMPFGIGISVASFIRATGYASAGMVAAMAIGSLATGTDMSAGSGGAQMYDTGGYIPYNRTGVVGEYGPELVTGPAHVRGRGSSSSSLGGGGGNTYSITLAPQIAVHMGGDGGANSGATEQDGRKIADIVGGIVNTRVQDMIRPQGLLDNWIRQRS